MPEFTCPVTSPNMTCPERCPDLSRLNAKGAGQSCPNPCPVAVGQVTCPLSHHRRWGTGDNPGLRRVL